MYVGLGKLAAALDVDVQAAFHFATVAARAVLLISGYLFAAAVLPTIVQRRIAWALMVCSSDLTGQLAVVSHVAGRPLGLAPSEFNEAELSTSHVLLTAPHLMLGLALLILAARCYLDSWKTSGLVAPLAAGLAVSALGLTNSFSLVTLGVVVLAHLVVSRLCCGTLPGQPVAVAGMIALATAPFLAYSLLVFGRDPFWSATYVRQNLTVTAPLLSVLLAFGVVLALALVGPRSLLRQPTPERLFVATWVAVSLLLMYAPVGFQRRFAFGLHPMLSIAAAVGLAPVWAWARRTHVTPRGLLRPLATFALAQLVVGSTFLLYLFFASVRARIGAADSAEVGSVASH